MTPTHYTDKLISRGVMNKVETIWNAIKKLNISYGFLGTDNNTYVFDKMKEENFDRAMSKYYKLQSAKEMIKTKVGVCYDTVELLRSFFRTMQIPHKTFYIEKFFEAPEESHTILVANFKGKLYYPEWSFGKIRGLHTEFADYIDIFNFVIDTMRQSFYHPEKEMFIWE